VPGTLYSFYGLTSTAGGQFVMQLYGAALLMDALISWQLRHIGPGPTRQALTLALFVQALAGLAATLLAQIGGVMNSLGWGVVVLLAIFAVGYGCFRFVRPVPASLDTPPAP
jgi:hypothetical protein